MNNAGAASEADAAKRAAGDAAASLVEDGMRLGLGTGSTAWFVVEALGRRVREDGLRVTGVPTSLATERHAASVGITLAELADLPGLDLAIDGADEIEEGTLRLIKGLGGALLREKMVAQAARRFVIVGDEGKVVRRLGEHAPLPVEVVRFAHAATARRLPGRPVLRERDGAPFVTDNGNLIYDCFDFGPANDPEAVAAALGGIAGVVGHGLFLRGVEQAIIGLPDGGTRRVQRSEGLAVLVLMGVAGSGKTTVAQRLSEMLGWRFQEGDDLHPPANVEKMRNAVPLTDEDRAPWLQAVAGVIDGWRRRGEHGVLTCSALKRAYRNVVVGDRPDVGLVYMRGTKEIIAGRLAARHGHYMPATLLDSQLAALEEPAPDEHAIVVDVGPPPEDIVRAIAEAARIGRTA